MLRRFVTATAALGFATMGFATMGLATMGLATGAEASDWRTNPDIYETGLFLDMSSYKILPNGNRQIWILQAFQKPVETSGGPVDFRVSLFEFNCLERSQAAKYTVVYFMDGQSDSNEKPAVSLPSDPSADRMSDVVCGDLSRLTAVPGDAPALAHRYRAIGRMALQ
jgi:hypothetical protein